jgi:phosphoribosyl 1,2-cyclic phosphodiesterase
MKLKVWGARGSVPAPGPEMNRYGGNTSCVELGLSDGFGSVDFVAREVIKAEDIFDYTKKQDFTERFAKRFGAAMASALAKVLAQGQFNIR